MSSESSFSVTDYIIYKGNWRKRSITHEQHRLCAQQAAVSLQFFSYNIMPTLRFKCYLTQLTTEMTNNDVATLGGFPFLVRRHTAQTGTHFQIPCTFLHKRTAFRVFSLRVHNRIIRLNPVLFHWQSITIWSITLRALSPPHSKTNNQLAHHWTQCSPVPMSTCYVTKSLWNNG